MRQKLEGVQGVTGLPEEYFEFKLARRFGWSKREIDEAPAHWLDWMMAISDIANG